MQKVAVERFHVIFNDVTKLPVNLKQNYNDESSWFEH